VREKDSQCGSSAPNSWPLNPRHPVSSVYATATSSDKDADGRKLWFGFLGTLSGSQRATMAAEMSEEANEICRSGIRARHPEYTTEQVHLAFLRIILGDSVLHEALPNAPLLAP
jgi:hypothetical protein